MGSYTHSVEIACSCPSGPARATHVCMDLVPEGGWNESTCVSICDVCGDQVGVTLVTATGVRKEIKRGLKKATVLRKERALNKMYDEYAKERRERGV